MKVLHGSCPKSSSGTSGADFLGSVMYKGRWATDYVRDGAKRNFGKLNTKDLHPFGLINPIMQLTAKLASTTVRVANTGLITVRGFKISTIVSDA